MTHTPDLTIAPGASQISLGNRVLSDSKNIDSSSQRNRIKNEHSHTKLATKNL